jgi:DNA-binding NtrC family response regulator
MEGSSILIVDDEVVMVSELTESFTDEGYRAYGANSGNAALQLLSQHPDIAVLISDVRMPDCDGPTLVRTSLTGRPESLALEVIFMTGHATTKEMEAVVDLARIEVIRKPFRLDDLFAVSARALARAVDRRQVARGLAPNGMGATAD